MKFNKERGETLLSPAEMKQNYKRGVKSAKKRRKHRQARYIVQSVVYG